MTTEPNSTEAVANFDQIDADDFARLIAEASDEQIAEIVDGPTRKQVLDQIFRRMADHVDAEQARGVDAVVHFKILDRPEELGGGGDHDGKAEAGGRRDARQQVDRLLPHTERRLTAARPKET
jgi:hypothetical protein